jgi:hypothetical protein
MYFLLNGLSIKTTCGMCWRRALGLIVQSCDHQSCECVIFMYAFMILIFQWEKLFKETRVNDQLNTWWRPRINSTSSAEVWYSPQTSFFQFIERQAVTLNNWPLLQENADILMDFFPAVSLYVVVNSCDSRSLYVWEDPQNCSYYK